MCFQLSIFSFVLFFSFTSVIIFFNDRSPPPTPTPTPTSAQDEDRYLFIFIWSLLKAGIVQWNVQSGSLWFTYVINFFVASTHSWEAREGRTLVDSCWPRDTEGEAVRLLVFCCGLRLASQLLGFSHPWPYFSTTGRESTWIR